MSTAGGMSDRLRTDIGRNPGSRNGSPTQSIDQRAAPASASFCRHAWRRAAAAGPAATAYDTRRILAWTRPGEQPERGNSRVWQKYHSGVARGNFYGDFPEYGRILVEIPSIKTKARRPRWRRSQKAMSPGTECVGQFGWRDLNGGLPPFAPFGIDLRTTAASPDGGKAGPRRRASGRRTPDRRSDRRVRSRLRGKQGRCAGVGADARPARSADGPSGDTRRLDDQLVARGSFSPAPRR